jgi:hypothetical protein
MQHVALSPKRRTVDRVPAQIAGPRQMPVLATARRGPDDAATPQTVAVGAAFRWPDHPRTVYAGDKITNAMHALGIPGDGDSAWAYLVWSSTVAPGAWVLIASMPLWAFAFVA